MKTNVKFAVTVAVLSVMFGCAAAVQAQVKTGGYKSVENDDAGAVAAAGFAVKAQSQKIGETVQLIAVQKAERQIVAGSNYRLCLEVTPTGDETADSVFALVVVYVDLKNNYKLTSWTDFGCGNN